MCARQEVGGWRPGTDRAAIEEVLGNKERQDEILDLVAAEDGAAELAEGAL